MGSQIHLPQTAESVGSVAQGGHTCQDITRSLSPKKCHLEGDGHTQQGQCIETTSVASSHMDQPTYMEEGMSQTGTICPIFVFSAILDTLVHVTV